MSLRSAFIPVALMAAMLGLLKSAAAAGETWPYTIVRGDTLIGLRDRLLRPGSDWRELQRLNRVTNPRRLMPGRTLQIPTALLPEEPLEVEVLHSHGQVTLRRLGQPEQPLAGGSLLATGDAVATGPQSSATLRFADGTRVLLRPDSLLRIERSVRQAPLNRVTTQLRLDEGSVDSRVPRQPSPRFEIHTPVANLGVRGTEFRTRTHDGQTTVEVLEGVVASPPAGDRLVGAGYGAQATARGLAPALPLPDAPGVPGLPQRVERLPLQLRWAAPAGARYRAQIFAAEQPDRLLLDGLFEGGLVRWGDDLPDGHYLLHLRAVAADGIEGRDQQTAFTLKARPEPPYLAFPPDGARLLAGQVQFSWTRPSQAVRYRMQLAASAGFEQPLVDRSDIESTELRVDLPPGSFHWRLASLRGDGDQGPWSDTLRVTGVTVPPPPEGHPPEFTDGGVLLRWRARVGASYQVQVAADPGFTQVLFDQRVSSPQWLLPEPAAGTYHVRVRTTDADGFVGPYGELQRVEVPHSKWWWLLLVPALLAI